MDAAGTVNSDLINVLKDLRQSLQTKIGSQDQSPGFTKFLENFLSSIKDKVSNKKTTEKPKSIAEEFIQAQVALARNTEYQNKHREFLKKVFTRDLKEALMPGIAGTNPTSQSPDDKKPKLIKEEEKPKKVILADITENASRSLKEKFTNIFSNVFKGFFDKLKGFFDKLQGPKGGFGIIGGALALLLGGLAALVAGLMTDGPFKGLLKILSKVGIQGALKVLELAAKFFLGNLKMAVMAPIELLKGAARSIGQIFGKGTYRTILKTVQGAGNIFTRILGSFGRFFTKGILTKIPIIGSLISFGFAFTRFRSGDVIGGLIDVVSGLVPLLYLTGVGAPFVIPIQLGLDVLNAMLDFKAGGANKQASAKKGGILLGWLKNLGLLLYRGVKSLPIIGPAIKAVEEFSAGNYLKGLKQLAYIITPLEFVGALFGDKEASGLTKTTASVFRGIGSILKSLGKWIVKTTYKVLKNTFIIGPMITAVEAFSKGEFLRGLKQLAYIFPVFEVIGAMLGDTDVTGMASGTGSLLTGLGQIVTDLWTWMKDTMWEKISGFVTGLIDGIKSWWSNLSWDPRSWVGMTPETTPLEPPASKTSSTNQTKDTSNNELNKWSTGTTTAKNQSIPMADGGIVTQPTNALIGEAGPEAVVPLEKYFNNQGLTLNNTALTEIAANTSSTNTSLKVLSEALIRLVTIIDRKISQPGSNTSTIINMGGGNDIPSAAKYANTNIDPIRAIRAQFA